MSYATIQDAKTLYGDDYVLESVDRDDNGVEDTASLTRALAQASSHMDSYLGMRYDVPLSTVPSIVQTYCIDIAIYRASSSAGRGLTDEKRERYKDALVWLKDVSTGKAGLGLEDTDETTEHLPQLIAGERLFTRGTMGDL